MAHHEGDLLGIAAFLTFLFALATFGTKRPDVLMTAFAQLTIWSFSSAVDTAHKGLNGPIDLTLAAWIAWAWWTHKESWKVLFLGLVLAQTWFDVAFQANSLNSGILLQYKAWLNITFAAQLICVSWPGGVACAHALGDWMRRPHDSDFHWGHS